LLEAADTLGLLGEAESSLFNAGELRWIFLVVVMLRAVSVESVGMALEDLLAT